MDGLSSRLDCLGTSVFYLTSIHHVGEVRVSPSCLPRYQSLTFIKLWGDCGVLFVSTHRGGNGDRSPSEVNGIVVLRGLWWLPGARRLIGLVYVSPFIQSSVSLGRPPRFLHLCLPLVPRRFGTQKWWWVIWYHRSSPSDLFWGR